MKKTSYKDRVGEFSTLTDLLRSRAKEQPDKTAYIFLVNSEAEEKRLLYKELDLQARAVAASLQKRVNPGARVLLLYPSGLEFISAFFGCLYANVIAVPCYPPDPRKLNVSVTKLTGIIRECQPELILTTNEFFDLAKLIFRQYPELKQINWMASDTIDAGLADDWQKAEIHSDSLAFLQYTSGSTGSPKGVMVSHQNIIHNQQMIAHGFGHTKETIFVGWLPLFHDMGLIGNTIQPLYLGIPSILMDPVAFLQKPLRWLEAISRYRATTSGAPNFAYSLCARKIKLKEIQKLDLSCWDVAYCGAEPIYAQTVREFTKTFKPCGFKPEAFYPCYGMAEATLFVSGGIKTKQPVIRRVKSKALKQNRVVLCKAGEKDSLSIIGCGKTWLDQKIVIVDPKIRTLCKDNQVGEIWTSGKSVTKGYWNRPEQTEKFFSAYLADTKQGPFLRTGDLGFIKGNELFVTGRLKDLIIIRGQNHYPNDIEQTAEQSDPGLRPGCCAAFSVNAKGEERLVLVQEVRSGYVEKLNAKQIIESIKRVTAQIHNIEIYAVVLVKPKTIPKTSSGKIQRRACKEMFESGTLNELAGWKANVLGRDLQTGPASTKKTDRFPSVKKIENWLIVKIAERLSVNPKEIKTDQPLSDYGFGSMASVEISGQIEQWLKCKAPPTLLYDYPCIKALAEYLGKKAPKLQKNRAQNHKHAQSLKAVKHAKSESAEFEKRYAIVGIGCRFPGADNSETFWNLLCSRTDSVTEVPRSRWDVDAFYDPEPGIPGKMNTRWGGFLDKFDYFDAHFFGISSKEAQAMDPQQRILLETAWEALENAGQSPEKLAGTNVGVFIGISTNDYKKYSGMGPYSGTGNAFSMAANRLSYQFDLRGPSMAVDTACSSSLVAVHHACRSLESYDCDLAIAGGVNLILNPDLSVIFSQARMMAPDGKCKTFDAKADGYVRSEGCGVVILKRVSDAIKNNDNIFALIRGSAVNQDGRTNGLTAPNGPSQREVICKALKNANVRPAQINFVETHGTGTALGDPIEVNSLKEVLMEKREIDQKCFLGSVKTNIGHLEAGAGIASLIKTALCLYHKQIPPVLHFKQLNPLISIKNTPVSIPTNLKKWPTNHSAAQTTGFAGVSSFGFGGTNAHVILEQAPSHLPQKDKGEHLHLFVLSAKKEKALIELCKRYEKFLSTHPQISLADICFTAVTGRSHFRLRIAIITDSKELLRKQLKALSANKKISKTLVCEPAKKIKDDFLQKIKGMAEQYVDGADINWLEFYKSYLGKRVELPSYPFQGKQYPVKSACSYDCAGPVGELKASAKIPVLANLIKMVTDLSGIEERDVDPEANMFQMGIDSLMLGKIKQRIAEEFSVDIKMSKFYQETDTLNKIAKYILKVMPQKFTEPDSSKLPQTNEQLSSVKKIITDQIQLMLKQLEAVMQVPLDKEDKKKEVVPNRYSILSNKEPDKLNSRHKQFIKDFTARYNKATQKSKDMIQKYRPVFSDWVNTAGYRQSLKGLRYPIVSCKSSGSKIWDIDGNQYIDIAMGYGVNFFGNNPPFVAEAIRKQLKKGTQLGPQFDLTGKVAELIRELTHAERVTFSNTGTEAVMAALRIARAVTGRDKIALFAGSYHGTSDSILAVKNKKNIVIPSCPGIPFSMVQDVLVLNYGSKQALDLIDEHGSELAAVLVEPVQSRRPGFHPKEFLLDLRQITAKTGTALIFDEIITGFRICQGGAQAYFGVKADIATYGKIAAGGMPIGIIAGKAEFLDAIDGGDWNYEDTSCPEKQTTIFAGTFCKHPLTMAAAFAALSYLKKNPKIQEKINSLTSDFANRLNLYFDKECVPIKIKRFGSVFRFESYGKYDLLFEPIEMDILFYLLMEKGVYTWERRICFFSTAHTREDINFIIDAVKKSIKELRAAGFQFSYKTDSPDKPDPGTLTSLQDHSFTNYPATSMQKRIFALCRSQNSDLTAYHLTEAVTVKGDLDIKKFELCFKDLIKRHESLRTGFIIKNEQILQQIHNQVDFKIEYKQSKTEDQDKVARDFIRHFDLGTPPLCRICVIKLKSGSQVLIFDIHHIIGDGLSANIIFQELMKLYQGLKLEPACIQYKDFAFFEQKYLLSEQFKKDQAYWLNKYSDEIPVLNIPTDYSRPRVQSFDGDNLFFKISREETSALKNIANTQKASLFMLLFAAYYAFLHRLSGYNSQCDIIVGIPVAGRQGKEFLNAVGMFVNTLAIRCRFKDNQSFSNLVQKIKKEVLKGYEHQFYQFDALIEKLDFQRDMSRNPLFNTMFVYEKADQRIFRVKDLTFTHYDFKPDASMVDFTLEVIEAENELNLRIEYSTKLFKKETIKRYLQYYLNILKEITKDPEIKIQEIDILPQTEKHKIMVQWNQTKTIYPKYRYIHQLFEKQAEKTPEAVALVYPLTSSGKGKAQQLTYKELNKRADRLAHYLNNIGVGPDVLVGICLQRSIEMIVGIIGILKAKGAYLPLDPEYPKERLRFMLEDANINFLLINKNTRESLPEHKAQTIDLTDVLTNSNCFKGRATDDKHTGLSAMLKNIAYLIYTSGSTGRPKGVVMEHGPLLNLIQWQVYHGNLAKVAKTLQFASLNFDVSFQEIASTLCFGGTLVIAPEHTRKDPAALLKFIKQNQIQRIFLPFIALQHLALTITQIPKTLREVITAGEQLHITKEIISLFKKMPNCTLHNHYGPTESHVVTAYKLPKNPRKWREFPPIGRQISNSKIYILDKNLKPVPLNVPGQLYIAGPVLAREYLNQARVTKKKFINNLFIKDEPQTCKNVQIKKTCWPNYDDYSRLYKTGDLCRWLPDGNIEFLGRIDHQVKIRGFRIELGEIEATLSKHVKENVVAVKETGSGDKYLTAYIVKESLKTKKKKDKEKISSVKRDQEIIASIRQELKKSLPDYMIPAFFLFLDTLPLNPNGKIDRKALPEPNFAELKKEYTPPRDPREEIIGKAWAQILGLENIGVYDNFFNLGGHSIIAARAVSKVRELLQLKEDIPVRSIFENPTIDEFTKLIVSGYYQKSEAKIPQIKPVPRDKPIQLSLGQQNIWLVDKLEGKSPNYNMPGAVRITGDLNIKVLEKTVQEIVRRHETLRTVFKELKGLPVQTILPHADFKLIIKDMQNIDKEKRESTALKEIEMLSEQPFDLTKWPLLKILVYKLDTEKQILFFNIHHIICDGWSISIFARELTLIYSAFLQNRPSPLPDLEIRYADFAVWQREWFTGKVAHLNYWKKQLKSPPSMLTLPTDRPVPAVKSLKGGVLTFLIEKDLTKQIKKLCIETDTTLFMTLYAAFAVLLYKYSGQTDILIGSPIANRRDTKTEPLIGLFLNTIILRVNLSEDPRFINLLNQVKKTALDAYTYPNIPFEDLFKTLDIKRTSSINPLFQVMFVMQNTPASELTLPGIKIDIIEERHKTSKFDLLLDISEVNGELKAGFEYCADLFDKETIKQMALHFKTLLTDIVKNQNQKISKLSLMTQNEKAQLLINFNKTKTKYIQSINIHHKFEQQVKKTPYATAVICEGKKITYKKLNDNANRLAHYLRAMGVGPEIIVGISLNRSIDMIVGIISILKAGGAYMPLDPQYPKKRLSFIIKDSKAKFLLTQQSLKHKISEKNLKTVLIDRDWPLIVKRSTINPQDLSCPNNLAYIIYTSGSSGKPKGVMIEHKSLSNFSKAAVKYYKITGKDRILQFASISFDTSAEEIYPCLTVGGTLILRTDQSLLTPSEFIGFCRKHDITVIDLPTAFWSQLVSEAARSNLRFHKNLRLLIIGGEKAKLEHIKLFNNCKGHKPVLVNTYGPTEATVVTTAYTIAKTDLKREPPIGKPIAGNSVYILDKNLNPVPINIYGELCISGPSVARGYLNQPGLTKKKFIKNQLTLTPNTLLYKTGDLARYLPDLNIEFFGRIDNQVKIRGFRIELGEIESAILKQPLVKECVVNIDETDSKDKRLIAYIVKKTGDREPEPKDRELLVNLREFLKKSLPDYMIPAIFVFIDKIPLTPNSKIDKKALPEPDFSVLKKGYVPPRNPTQKLIASVWVEVLGLKQIGIYDNFFDLGGHSLLAGQVISRLKEAFSLKPDLTVRAIFESPTIAELSKILDHTEPSKKRSGLPEILPNRSANLQIPLSFAQQRLWFLDKLESAAYNMPGAIHINGQFDIDVAKRALQEIIRRHESLRTVFKESEKNGIPFQVILSDMRGLALTKLVDLTDCKGCLPTAHDIALKLIEKESQTHFDLSQGPLFRSIIYRLSKHDHILFINMHHIVSDGWSIGILIREFKTLYTDFLKNRESQLPKLDIKYTDFAIWQRKWLSGKVLETQLNYWKKQLAGIPDLLKLPADRPGPAVQTFKGTTVGFTISENLTEKLKRLSKQANATLFMIFYAAFATLLYRCTSQSDIVIGTPIANRNHPAIENIIGFFVNTLVLRANLADDPEFKSLLNQVKETTLDAYAHQDIPFERLVEELQPARSLSHSPVFQVMFAWHNEPEEIKIPNITLNMLKLKCNISPFNLTLNMLQGSDSLSGSFEYNTDLFNKTTIKSMILHFKTLLNSIADTPKKRVSELEIMTKAEKNRILIKWNNTKKKHPNNKCAHELFEDQVQKTPDAIAVQAISSGIGKDKQLTYKELNKLADKLADYLQLLGVGPDVLVGICLQRSIEMIVGIIGILKAKGAYLPLDPQYPEKRLEFMIQDAGIEILLIHDKTEHQIPETSNITIINLTNINTTHSWTPASQVKHSVWTGRAGRPMRENLAYLIYTSGSTGSPKGVMIQHQALTNFIFGAIDIYKINSQDRILQFASISFDTAAEEIFPWLSCGATLILRTDEMLGSGKVFLETCRKLNITVLDLPTYFWGKMVSEIAELNLLFYDNLRLVIIGGEHAKLEHIKLWHSFKKRPQLTNGYGPTEATIAAIFYTFPNVKSKIYKVLIGRPIANVQTYILDSHLNPVPIMTPGELYIGGSGLAKGYLNQPELTKERFINNQFIKQKAFLYKTGDLCQYLPDSNIEFLGRIDHQVKVRGFRIELGEIEAALSKHKAVKENIVTVKETKAGEKHLTAYIIKTEKKSWVKSDQEIIASIRQELKKSLPDYMIPGFFLFLDELPLTTNGKIDHKSLPDPGFKDAQKTYIAPRNQAEKLMASIWAEILEPNHISVNDNFFDLGGHSLLAVQLMSKIEQKFGKNIPLAALFQNPTIEQLATAVHTDSLSWESLVPIQLHGKKPALFFIPGAGGNVLYLYHLSRALGSDRPFYGLQAIGLNGKTKPHSTIEQMADHYIKCIQKVQNKGPYLLAGHSQGGLIAYQIARQLQTRGHEIKVLAIMDIAAPIISTKQKLDQNSLLCELCNIYEQFSGKKLGIKLKELKPLNWEEKFKLLKKHLQKAGIIFPGADMDHVKGLVQVYKASTQMNYTPSQKKLRIPITLFRAIETDSKQAKEMEQEFKQIYKQPKMGWYKFSSMPVNVYKIPGDHFTMMAEPNVKILAEKLTEALEKTRKKTETKE